MYCYFAKSKGRTQRGEAVRPVFVVLLCLVGMSVGGYWGWQAWEDYVSKAVESQTGGARSRSGGTDRIIIADKALTNDSIRALLEPWLREAWQADGLKNPAIDLIPTIRWRPFVKAAIAEELDGPDKVSRTRLVSMAMDLHVEALRHPVAAAVVGHVLPAGEIRSELLKAAFDGLSPLKGAETLAWHAACDLALAPEQNDTKASDRALTALRAALQAENGFSSDHDQLAAFKLLQGSRRTFLQEFHEDFWQSVEPSSGMKPWLKQWVKGLHHIQAGWEARGGGYSNSVSNRGWKVFDIELGKARSSLEAAWKEKPEHAGPAVSLIYANLNMKQQSLPLMRRWFDEVVKVHADNEEAYRNVLWGLRPRWYGSYALMQKFGEQCLKTGRFDTDGPWFFALAHVDCASEWDLPDYYFREFSKIEELAELLDGYESSPKRDAWRSHDRTHAAIWNFKCGRYKEAQQWLQKLDFKPHERVLEDWGGLDKDFVIGKIAAFAGDEGSNLRDAEKAEDKFRSSEAKGLYRAGLDASKNLSDLGKRYLRNRIAMMDAEAKFSAGETFAPALGEELAGWTRVGDGWFANDSGVWRTGIPGPATLTHLARVGPAFELSGEIEITDPGNVSEAWITYGYPPPAARPRWGAVRFVIDHGKPAALLSANLGEPVHASNFDAAPRYVFVLNVNKGRLNLTINGRKVWDGVLQIDGAVKEAYAQFGIGCASGTQRTQVKFTKLSLRKF